MIINEKRALCYNAKIGWVKPIEGADNIELVGVNGWTCVAKKGEFQVGDICVYFEIDSKCPEAEWSAFLEPKHYKVKTMKLGKFKVISQGLALPLGAFDFVTRQKILSSLSLTQEVTDLTEVLGVTYAVEEDNKRKGAPDPNTKYTSMKARHRKFFSNPTVKKLMKHEWFRKFIFAFLGKKKDSLTAFPVGRFPGVSKTDQERCENMPWILNDKTPFVRTQKCDGSSGTFILERKGKKKFEFWVCSRNVRMLKPDQECFHDKNYYWEVAFKYNIEAKMKAYLESHPDMTFVCWQGEICGPAIQKNPHKLKEVHLFCFHWTDSENGRLDIREAAELWRGMGMEVVPIDKEEYILPDDFEEFKESADGNYDASVCEGVKGARREGYVYYKTTDPNFSFKNVSRIYLLKQEK